MKTGPFVRVGKAVFYPIDELEAWDEEIECSAVRPSDSLGHQ